MNPRSDTDGLLRHWFEDGPTTMPDRVVDVVADRIGRQAQRRSWRLRGRPFMNRYVKVAAGLAAAVVFAVAGWQLLPRNVNIGGTPTPTPTSTLRATPTSAWPWWVGAEDIGRDCGAGPSDGGLPRGCSRELTAGTHQSVGLVPPVQFTVPAGWINTQAWQQWWTLMPDTPVTRAGRDLRITVIPDFTLRAEGCADSLSADVPTSAEFMAAIDAIDGVDSTAPVSASVGALSGQSVDLQMAAGWTGTCPEDPGTVVVPVLSELLPKGGRMRYILLEAPGDRNVLVKLIAPDQAAFETLLAEGMPIVNSFVFDFGPAAS